MLRDVGQALKLWIRLVKNQILEENSSFSVWDHERARGRERKSPRLLSSILEVPFVGIRQAKNYSSLPRRGLRVCTKKEGFHRRSKGGDLGKSKFSS